MPETKELILKMLEKDPEKRIELMDFMDTDYFKMDDSEFKTKWLDYYEKNKPKEEKKEQQVPLEYPPLKYKPTKKQSDSPRRSPSPRSKGKLKKKVKEEEQYAIVLKKEPKLDLLAGMKKDKKIFASKFSYNY